MQLFIDSGIVEEIKEAAAMGAIDGVTTNPSLMAQAGRPTKDVIAEICDIRSHLRSLGLEASRPVVQCCLLLRAKLVEFLTQFALRAVQLAESRVHLLLLHAKLAAELVAQPGESRLHLLAHLLHLLAHRPHSRVVLLAHHQILTHESRQLAQPTDVRAVPPPPGAAEVAEAERKRIEAEEKTASLKKEREEAEAAAEAERIRLEEEAAKAEKVRQEKEATAVAAATKAE